MRFFSTICVGLAICGHIPTTLHAQHLHRHGNHFDVHQNVPHGHDSAGHLTDSYGHHIDGDGRHTGAIGVFENGSHGAPMQGHLPAFGGYPSYGSFSFGSSYYSAPYSTPYFRAQVYGAPYTANPYTNAQVLQSQTNSSALYGAGTYSGSQYAAPRSSIPTILGNSSVIGPTSQATAATPTASIVANRIPIPATGVNAPSKGGALGPDIHLRNPRDSGGSVNYSLNEFQYTINPGEAQQIPSDRRWTLRFDNGLGKSVALQLNAGSSYDFSVSQQSGWSIGPRSDPQH